MDNKSESRSGEVNRERYHDVNKINQKDVELDDSKKSNFLNIEHHYDSFLIRF